MSRLDASGAYAPRPRPPAARAPVLAVLAVAALLPGCADWFLAPEPAEDPVAIFDAVWTEFDLYYSYFGYKGIDWDSVYDAYRPRIQPGTGPVELSSIIGEMVVGLEDGHADLYAGQRQYSYTGWYEGYPENWVPNAIDRHVYSAPPSLGGPNGRRSAPEVTYGWVDDRIGYIRIPTFGRPGVREGIDVALTDLADTDALILDIRQNGGGSDTNSDAVLGRFLERRLLVQYHAYRNGPEHDDFTDRVADYVEPRGGDPYPGALAVLTNRRTFSTAEAFVLGVRELRERRYTVTVGDTTGGGFGNPVWRELPNGWTFRVPRWQVWSVDGVQYEGVGIPPDVPLNIVDGTDPLYDPILSTAANLLRDAISP